MDNWFMIGFATAFFVAMIFQLAMEWLEDKGRGK